MLDGMIRTAPLRLWPMIRSQMVKGKRHSWDTYAVIVRIGDKLGFQYHAASIYSRSETALDRQNILRRKYKAPKGMVRL